MCDDLRAAKTTYGNRSGGNMGDEIGEEDDRHTKAGLVCMYSYSPQSVD